MIAALQLSIIIPTLGEKKKLFRLLQSLQEQNFSDSFAVYVIDNSLESKLDEEINKLTLGYQFQIHLLKCDKKGVNWARNLGLHSCNADIALFLDDDCWLRDQNLLTKHVAFHQQNADSFAIGGYYHVPYGKSIFDHCYHDIQMRWLQAGMNSETQQSHYLIGGHFSIKMQMARTHSINFNDQITYGGSELSFFQKSCQSGLPLILKNIYVMHDTNENLKSLTRKLFMQGLGKALAQQQYLVLDNLGSTEYIQVDKGALLTLLNLYLKFIFWFGFYYQAKDYKGFLNYLISNLRLYFHQQKQSYIRHMDKKLQNKKDRGDLL